MNRAAYKVYTTDESVEDLHAKVRLAAEEKCDTVLLPGAFCGEVLAKVQEEYPEIRFIGMDVYPDDVMTEDWETVPLGKNSLCLTFREDQAGFLAGYAAVRQGFKELGVLGGMDVPAVERYSYGFIQGADQAAKELGLEDVRVRHVFSGTFWATDEAQERMESWYADGVEAVFSCGGNVWTSLVEPARAYVRKIIGVDVDQAELIDEAVCSGTCLTSAMKDFAAAAEYILTEIGEGRWEDYGGAHTVLGVEKSGCFVGLPASTLWNEGFSEANYDEVCEKLVTEEILVSDALTAPETAIEVVYEGNPSE